MNQYFIENNRLKSNIKENKVSINNINFSFFTDNGLFNKKGLDLGTKILLENFDFKNKTNFLDMGCGCGPIGIYLSLLDNKNKVDMVDINSKAIELVKKSLKQNNIKNAKCFISNGFSKVIQKYDAILFNPPIHAGKKVIYEIIKSAKNYLSSTGELWIVIRKDHGAKSLINDFNNEYDYKLIKKDHGFWIINFSNKK